MRLEPDWGWWCHRSVGTRMTAAGDSAEHGLRAVLRPRVPDDGSACPPFDGIDGGSRRSCAGQFRAGPPAVRSPRFPSRLPPGQRRERMPELAAEPKPRDAPPPPGRRWPTDIGSRSGRYRAVARRSGRLPFRQQVVLIARCWLDLTEVEIAAVVNCRPGTVKSLAARALSSLHEEMK